MTTLRPTLLAVFAGLTLAMPALAQNVLDANPQKGAAGQNNKVRDFQAMQRFNEAVVTGRAGGGKSFQGSTGYVSGSEFRGVLSSDRTYSFERDAANAGMVTRGIRSSDALKYQFALSSGQPTDPQMSQLMSTARPGAGTASTGAEVSAMRSTATYTSTQSRLPTVVGFRTDNQGNRTAMTASPLRGVAGVAMDESSDDADALSAPALTGLERYAPGVRMPEKKGDKTKPGDKPAPGSVATISTKLDTSATYNALFDASKAAADKNAEKDPSDPAKPGLPGTDDKTKPKAKTPWEKQLDSIRDTLKPQLPGDKKKDAKPANDVEAKLAEDKAKRLAEEKKRKEEEAVRVLKGVQEKAPRVSALVAHETSVSDRYITTMSQGNIALENSNYFDAEGAFGRALAIRPGDVMAQVGRMHAQLGAGLFASAGANLRTLLSEHPEMIPIRYEPGVLLKPARVPSTAGALSREISKPDSTLDADAALLLAYMGYQHSNPDWLRSGLGALKAKSKAGSADASLAQVLSGVWVDAKAPPATPEAPKADAPKPAVDPGK